MAVLQLEILGAILLAERCLMPLATGINFDKVF